jgi:hypothetical protein
LSKDSWDPFIKIFVLFFFWSHSNNPWMNWKFSKTIQFVVSENFQYFENRSQFQKILFRNQCRNKRAFGRYASRRSVFGLRKDIRVRRKWITIYPYLSKNQMDNHGYPWCSAYTLIEKILQFYKIVVKFYKSVINIVLTTIL